MTWLARLAAGAEERLVVCRTQASVRAVLRSIAEGAAHAGFVGLQVSTLAGLLAEAEEGSIDAASPAHADPPLPDDHPWAASLRDRPRLRAELRGVMTRVHACAAAGVVPRLSPALDALRTAGWARDEAHVGAIRTLVSAKRDGVIAVGFGSMDAGFSFGGSFGDLERAVLAGICARPLDPSNAPSHSPLASRLGTLRVADVAAEARAAVMLVGGDPDAMVLVPDAAGAARVSSALARNGIAVADDEPIALARHSLVAVLRPLVLLFEARGEAALDCADLRRLMRHPVLSSRDGDEYVAARQVDAMIAEARLVRAPVATWARRFESISAAVLARRMLRLAHWASHGTLAALGEWVSEIGLSDPTDAIGRRIIHTLRAAGEVAATLGVFDEVLARSTSSRRVDRGVRVLRYREYDGRPVGTLVLTGVHDKGLGRTPRPHPFVSDSDRRAFGLAAGVDVMRERLALARWAVRNAASAVALASDTDAMGRKVAFPVALVDEVSFDDSLRSRTYGLGLDVPELVDLSALGRRGAPDPLGDQIDSEWARANHRFREALPDDESRNSWDSLLPAPKASLDAYLARPLPARRVSLPLLGHVGAHPGSTHGLPPTFRLSASTLGHFTQCMYRAFAQTILKVHAKDEAEEEASAPELGELVHAVLAKAACGAAMIVPDRVFDRARSALRARLEAETDAEFARFASERVAHASGAVKLAHDGLRQRWSNHWDRWLDSRMVRRSIAMAHVAEALSEAALTWEESVALLKVLDDAAPDAHAVRKRIREGLGAAIEHAARCESEQLDFALLLDGLKNERSDVETALQRARKLRLAVAARFAREWRARAPHPDGDDRMVLAEAALDDTLVLGRESIPVRGRIDAIIECLRSDRSSSFHRIVDWKTGGSGNETAIAQTLTSPQLLFYALVVDAGLVASLGNRRLGEVAFDRLKGERIQVAVDDALLVRARTAFGALLDRARDGEFPLAPHPKGCPHTADGVYCDVQDACRYRGGS